MVVEGISDNKNILVLLLVQRWEAGSLVLRIWALPPF